MNVPRRMIKPWVLNLISKRYPYGEFVNCETEPHGLSVWTSDNF